MSFSELKIDFLGDTVNYARKKHRGKQELISKALGLGKGTSKVIDLTCGLAQDAFFIAQLGVPVLALERSPQLFAILASALAEARIRAPQREDLARLEIRSGDSREFLLSQEFLQEPHASLALYLDPMFPEKKKSALPRKEMQIFRQMVGEDPDSQELWKEAMQSGCSRLVVKRPLRAKPLGPGVVHMFKGTSVRYDLYTPSHRRGD